MSRILQNPDGQKPGASGFFGALRRPGDYYKMLLSLALPIVFQHLVTFSLSMTDVLFLGAVGENEISAVTLANAPFFVIMLMVFGFQSGASVLISQYWGKKDFTAISRVIGLTLFTSVSITAAVAVACMAFPRQIMSFFTTDPVLNRLACEYIMFAAPSYVLNSVVQVYLGACRSMENPRPGMYFMSVAMTMNAGLNYLLIFGKFGFPAMGVAGAALATSLSRVVEVVLTLVYVKINKNFRLDIRAMLRPGRVLGRDFLRYGGPVVVNETLWGLGISMMPAIFGRMGADAVASYTIAANVERVFSVAIFGLGNASGVIIGKAIGEGNWEKAYDASENLKAVALVLGVITGGALFLSVDSLGGWFNVGESTKEAVRVVVTMYALRSPANSIGMVMIVGVLRAGGAGRLAMLIDLVPMWLFALPGAALLALVYQAPIAWVYVPILAEEYIKVFISFYKTRRRDWMLNITRSFHELKGEGQP